MVNRARESGARFRKGTAKLKSKKEGTVARERLRRRYRPVRARVLFVGEAPPASGRFFYKADSGLYRAIQDAFATAGKTGPGDDFLDTFRAFGCYLVDLCGEPVDRMNKSARLGTCRKSELRLSRMLRQLRPEVVVVVVRSIVKNVQRSQKSAGWSGRQIELPYPGRWRRHRAVFLEGLIPLLRGLTRPIADE